MDVPITSNQYVRSVENMDIESPIVIITLIKNTWIHPTTHQEEVEK